MNASDVEEFLRTSAALELNGLKQRLPKVLTLVPTVFYVAAISYLKHNNHLNTRPVGGC